MSVRDIFSPVLIVSSGISSISLLLLNPLVILLGLMEIAYLNLPFSRCNCTGFPVIVSPVSSSVYSAPFLPPRTSVIVTFPLFRNVLRSICIAGNIKKSILPCIAQSTCCWYNSTDSGFLTSKFICSVNIGLTFAPSCPFD